MLSMIAYNLLHVDRKVNEFKRQCDRILYLNLVLVVNFKVKRSITHLGRQVVSEMLVIHANRTFVYGLLIISIRLKCVLFNYSF